MEYVNKEIVIIIIIIDIFQASCYLQVKIFNFKISNLQKVDLQKFNALKI